MCAAGVAGVARPMSAARHPMAPTIPSTPASAESEPASLSHLSTLHITDNTTGESLPDLVVYVDIYKSIRQVVLYRSLMAYRVHIKSCDAPDAGVMIAYQLADRLPASNNKFSTPPEPVASLTGTSGVRLPSGCVVLVVLNNTIVSPPGKVGRHGCPYMTSAFYVPIYTPLIQETPLSKQQYYSRGSDSKHTWVRVAVSNITHLWFFSCFPANHLLVGSSRTATMSTSDPVPDFLSIGAYRVS